MKNPKAANTKGAMISVKASGQEIDYKEILDHIPVCVTVVNMDGIFEYANAQYWKETGILPEEVLGRKVQEIESEGKFFRISHSALAIKERKHITAVSLNNSIGSHQYGYVNSAPIFDKDQNLVKVITTIMNPYDLRSGYEDFKAALDHENSVRIIEGIDNGESEILIGEDKNIQAIRRLSKRVAETNATVLITGESGSGKEAVADYIYDCSKRKDKPFVKINCAAIPADLLEAELFGYEKGAFTGANAKGKVGLLETANHGTVLLDEIGDLPLNLQPKLLRVLQQGALYRIGSNNPIKLDVRFIAATNSDLSAKVQDGSFRQDLYYRLRVIPISVPPLRERPDDVPRLVRNFLEQYCQKHSRTVLLTDEIMPLFQQYSWPGNVREVQNIIEYLVICTDEGESIRVHDVKSLFDVSPPGPGHLQAAGTLFERRDRFEKSVIEQTIAETGNIRETARQLGIYVSSLYRKIEKYNINTAELMNRNKGRQ